MLPHGAWRNRIACTLTAAYGDGLISEDTFVHRLDQVLRGALVDPRPLTGDLTVRRSPSRIRAKIEELVRRVAARRAEEPGKLLALDWFGPDQDLIVGRHSACDVVLSDPTVSRRHARIFFRHGRWILQDLQSTNGTTVNGVPVGRCELWPGDRVVLGEELLRVD